MIAPVSLPSRRDIAVVDIEPVLKEAKYATCTWYGVVFDEYARLAQRKKRTRQARVYWFLSLVCSVPLDAPLRPARVAENGRSALVDDFGTKHVVLLEQYLDANDPELRARIADLLWMTKKDRKKSHQYAMIAIDAYLACAQRLADTDQVYELREASHRFDRAASLASSLNKQEKLEEARLLMDRLFDEAVKGKRKWLPAELFKIALKHRGRTQRDYAALACKVAEVEEAKREWWQARLYWEESAAWHRDLKREADRNEALRRWGETYIQEAAASDSAIARMSFYNSALELLRQLPHSRPRQEDIKLLAYEAQQQFLSEAASFEFDVEIPREEAKRRREVAQSAVGGHSFHDAMLQLVHLFRCPVRDVLRESAEENVRDHPLRFAISSLTLGDNNKLISRTPNDSDSDKEWEANVLHEMYDSAFWYRLELVLTVLEPARHQLLSEHCPTFREIVDLIAQSPIIPDDRIDLVAEGILAGLRNDLVYCAHLLIPQFENMLRWLLTISGKSAFRITQEGTQEERELNSLLTNDEDIAKFLGRDLLFDLRGLLVESASVNLRNRIAHGMLRRDQIQHSQTAYFWWAFLSIILQSKYKPKSS